MLKNTKNNQEIVYLQCKKSSSLKKTSLLNITR